MSNYNVISNFTNSIAHPNMPTNSCDLFRIFFCLIIVGLFSVSEIHFIDHVKAQSSDVFRITVDVINNGNTDEYGTVYVNINDSQAIDGLGGQIFPAGETVSFEFVFDSKEIPIGKEFIAEVVYGDDIHKRVYGKNTSPNSSETININIP